MKSIAKNDIIILLSFIILGVLSRTIFHIAPNLEFITAFSLSAAYFMANKRLSLAVPLFVMFFSDLIIGNSNIFLFTWSAFLVIALTGMTQ